MKIALLHLSFLLGVCAAQKPLVLPAVLEGEDFRNSFSFAVPPGQPKIYLCRLPCKPEDMLMQVYGRRTKSGRYNLRLDGQVHVAITQVTKQDVGDYRVGLTSATSEELSNWTDFQLQIKDLCGGGVNRDKEREYWVSPGSNLTVPCELPLQPRNRKFLCREDCKAFLIDTNDEKGYSPRYGLEYVSPNSFNGIFKKLRASDVGRYRCGVGLETSNNYCQEFTIRMKGINLINPNNGNPGEGHETVPNLTEETGVTGVVLPIVVGLLVGIILALVILLIHLRRKIQSGRYVNINVNTSTRPGQRPPQPAPDNSGVPTYASLRPETRESEYSALELPPMQGRTNRDYLKVY